MTGGAAAAGIPFWRDLLSAVVGRITAVSAPPDRLHLLLTAGAVVLAIAVPRVWRLLRHGITIVHEAGHGAAATLTGRRLAGIRLHSDTSGVTVSVGRRRGAGMIATVAAGYPAPSAAGLLMAWAVGAGHAAAALWGAVALLVLVLLQIRNWFGLWSVLVAGVAVGAATWLLDAGWRSIAATALCALLLLGGLRAAAELPVSRARDRSRTSDADQLAALTRLPALAWVGVFVLLALAALAGAGLLLGPEPTR